MAIGDKYRLVTKGSLYGVTAVNVYYYEETAPTSDTFPQLAAADAFFEDVVPGWMSCLSNGFTLHCIESAVITAGPGAPWVKTLSSGNVGTRVGEALPANRVVCVSLYSEVYTKRGRGRHYFAGIRLADEEDNAISSNLFDVYEPFAESLTDPINESDGGQWKPVVFSEAAAAYYDIVAKTVNPQVRTLRGRTPRLC